MSSEYKTCSKCKKEKCINEFQPEYKNCIVCIEYRRRYRENNPEKIKQQTRTHYENNKERILNDRKEYREQNPEKTKEQKKQYKDNNPEKIKASKKLYYENHKEELLMKQKQKIRCQVCDCEINKYLKNKHEQTKKHQQNLNQKIKQDN